MRLFVGLRGRLVVALVAVAVVALAGATVALFTPLEQRVQRDALGSLSASADTARQEMEELPRGAIRRRSPALLAIARRLRHAGVEVVVLDRAGRPLVGADSDLELRVPFPEVRRTLRSRREIREVAGSGSDAEAVVVVPMATRAGQLTLGVRKSLKDAAAARRVFLVGFERAAVISLAIAGLLGFLLSTGLVRRIRALRSAVVRVAEEGPGVDLPADRRRDEIGDLARAFGRMQRRLHVQEEARKAFVATASHELRTPIAALRLRLGLLREDLAAAAPDLGDAREQVAHADEQAERLARLAADLLDLSRLDAEVPLLREPVPLASLCRATVAEFEAADGAPVALSDARAGTAMGDPGKVAQIVRILVDNARRYAPPDRPVRVCVEGAAIAVENDGPPVPADEQELIFERFRRGAGHDGHPGFGLGLAIGRGLARRMGGELRLTRHDGPTRFELTLEPASREPLPTADRRA
ncbi:MAG TPA: HAMP domain-containing sensor histidine kinase [Conexibacter sp.]|jgi:signal transduction histidine kinase|nr:HAMP domain-containing sensor histidine kinase [Conexibacter sp.]